MIKTQSQIEPESISILSLPNLNSAANPTPKRRPIDRNDKDSPRPAKKRKHGHSPSQPQQTTRDIHQWLRSTQDLTYQERSEPALDTSAQNLDVQVVVTGASESPHHPQLSTCKRQGHPRPERCDGPLKANNDAKYDASHKGTSPEASRLYLPAKHELDPQTLMGGLRVTDAVMVSIELLLSCNSHIERDDAAKAVADIHKLIMWFEMLGALVKEDPGINSWSEYVHAPKGMGVRAKCNRKTCYDGCCGVQNGDWAAPSAHEGEDMLVSTAILSRMSRLKPIVRRLDACEALMQWKGLGLK